MSILSPTTMGNRKIWLKGKPLSISKIRSHQRISNSMKVSCDVSTDHVFEDACEFDDHDDSTNHSVNTILNLHNINIH